MEKEDKMPKNKICEAPIHSSKYTTLLSNLNIILFAWLAPARFDDKHSSIKLY